VKILISACLNGEPVRYDGNSNTARTEAIRQRLQQWQQQGWLVAICPEISGGLPVPRPPAEIIAASGEDVLNGRAVIQTQSGDNVSAAFIDGAQAALALAQKHGVKAALLAARSPSCGTDSIYDGSFSGALKPGRGVTAALLEQYGIRCFTPENFAALEAFIAQKMP